MRGIGSKCRGKVFSIPDWTEVLLNKIQKKKSQRGGKERRETVRERRGGGHRDAPPPSMEKVRVIL